MLSLPNSIDPYLIQDQLLAILKQSPITEQLISMRAAEIVESILEKPIIQKLQMQIQTLNQMIDDEKKGKRVLRTQSKKKINERDKQVSNREELVRKMEKIIDENEEKIIKLEEECEQLRQDLHNTQSILDVTANQNEELSASLQTVKGQLSLLIQQQEQTAGKFREKEDGMIDMIQDLQKRISQQQLKNRQKDSILAQKEFQFNQNLAKELRKLELQRRQKDSETTKRDKDIEHLKEERFNLKNQINGLKIDVKDLQEALIQATKQTDKLSNQCLKLKEGIKSSKSHFDKERKMLNIKLIDLNKTSKAYRKLKVSFKQIVKNISRAQEEYNQFKKMVARQIEKMAAEVNTKVLATIDQVGEQVGTQIELLSMQLKGQAEQVRLAKTEIKIKEQAMERAEKQLTSESKEAIELKNQLKMRKREQQRLRRQLKKSYDESEHRFNLLQKKYYDLLNGLSY